MTYGSEVALRNRDILVRIGKELGSAYVYDISEIRVRVNQLRAAFPNFHLFYSIKANPNHAVLTAIRSLAIGAEITSAGEYGIARHAQFAPNEIIFTGPAKSGGEIRLALLEGIYALHIESLAELRQVKLLLANQRYDARIGLRVNTITGISPRLENMAGGSSRFGVDEESLASWLASGLDDTRLSGIHVYTGSQILNAGEIIDTFDRVATLAAKIQDNLGYRLEYVDFGGGFGVPHIHDQTELPLRLISDSVNAILATHADLHGVVPMWELGRYLVSSCGVFVSEVRDVKWSRGKQYVLTDTGMNGFMRPAFTGDRHQVINISRPEAEHNRNATLGGPLCTPLDILATEAVPDAQPGDIIAICNAGAYGFTWSPLSFLGHPWPAEVVIDGNDVRLVRRRVEAVEYSAVGACDVRL